MVVCICSEVSEQDIRLLINQQGCTTLSELQKHMTMCADCQTCKDYIESLLEEEAKDGL